MRAKWLAVFFSALLCAAHAAPVRVVLLDFEDETGLASDPQLGGTIDTKTLARKGIYLLAQEMLGTPEFSIVDQRDFMAQMNRLALRDEGESSPLKPSYLDAARALNADVLLRGGLLSFSTAKEQIDQGGHKVSMADVSLTVALQAQDAVDGAVIAAATGSARRSFRQTASVQTVLGEDDVLALLKEALAAATPQVREGIRRKVAELAARPRVRLTVLATEDPAMVEIDGVLVGTTPMEDLELYRGEHLFHVSRPGYESITKRVNLSRDAVVRVPMLRTDLTADEKRKILESAELRAYVTDGRPDLVIQTIE